MPQQMSAEQVRAMFPRASRSVLEANAFAFQPEIVSPKAVAEVRLFKLRKGKEPNATEHEYGLILEARKRKGEIVHCVFEGISLRWGDGMRYTCDWAVFIEDKPTKLVEIKGRQNRAITRRSDAIVRFKGCAAEWKTYFDFEMWEKSAQGWHQIF